MNALRIFQQPHNGSITITVPEELRQTLCEIIVLPAASRSGSNYSPSTARAYTHNTNDIQQFFGKWHNTNRATIDALAFQQHIRSEWESE